MSDYNDFIESNEWKNKKTSIIEIKGLVCAKCGREMDQRRSSQLHHKNYDKELGSEEEEDLMLVCEDCHKELHQDIEFFDNEEMRKRCPECRRELRNNKCLPCGIEVELK